MTVRRVSNGRPGTEVLPPLWELTGAAVTDKTLSGWVVVVGQDGTNSWDEGQGRTVTTPPEPVYTGPAAFSPLTDTGRRQIVVGEDDVSVVYEVDFLYESGEGMKAGQIIQVQQAKDPVLVGQELNIEHVLTGSGRFARRVYAKLRD